MERLLLIYDFIDTVTDVNLCVDLFKRSHFGWGAIGITSVCFGIFNLFLGLAVVIPDRFFKRCTYYNALVRTKKNLITSIFALSNDSSGDERKFCLGVYLSLFKLPENFPCALLRLFRHDLEKDVFYIVGSLTSIIGLYIAAILLLFLLWEIFNDFDFDTPDDFFVSIFFFAALILCISVVVFSNYWEFCTGDKFLKNTF